MQHACCVNSRSSLLRVDERLARTGHHLLLCSDRGRISYSWELEPHRPVALANSCR